MSPVHDIPLDVVLKDHTTFQKVLNDTKCDSSTESSYESTTDESSITTQSSQISDEVPMDIKIAETKRKIDYYTNEVVEASKKIGSLTLQLNRATASEQNLAIAVNDIEAQRLVMQDYFMEKRKKWKNLPHKEQELRAKVEQDFMNELISVTRRMEEVNRTHNHTMRGKDKEIKKLKEKLSQWEKVSGGGEMFYSS